MKTCAYEPDDLAELIALFKCPVLEGAARDYSSEQLLAWANAIEDDKTWARRLSGQMVMICERNGRLAGFVTMEANGHLDLMFVHPRHHRQGHRLNALLHPGGLGRHTSYPPDFH